MKWWRKSWTAVASNVSRGRAYLPPLRPTLRRRRRRGTPRLYSGLFCCARILEHVQCEIILDLGFVTQRLVVCGFQELFAAVAQLLPERLLHAGISQVTLASCFFGDQLHDHVSV